MKPACALIVFAKAPVPGQVKTRLAGVLGDDGAARLARRMLQDTLERAWAAAVGPVILCCAPDATHPQFCAAAQRGAELTLQGEGSIGDRMQRALAQALQDYPRALLIGTDAPGLAPAMLQAAKRALDGHDAVLAPAADGGYVLIGLRRPIPDLFTDIAWSTPDVMQQTRARIAHLGITAAELPLQIDIDEPSDLKYVPKEWLEK